jgi:hypothetical protein
MEWNAILGKKAFEQNLGAGFHAPALSWCPAGANCAWSSEANLSETLPIMPVLSHRPPSTQHGLGSWVRYDCVARPDQYSLSCAPSDLATSAPTGAPSLIRFDYQITPSHRLSAFLK